MVHAVPKRAENIQKRKASSELTMEVPGTGNSSICSISNICSISSISSISSKKLREVEREVQVEMEEEEMGEVYLANRHKFYARASSEELQDGLDPLSRYAEEDRHRIIQYKIR
jgi:hypothetical protein